MASIIATEKRGSISFFSTYRPPVPLELFSTIVPPTSRRDEVPLTDGVSYNHNGRVIPQAALRTILKRLPHYEGKEAEVGRDDSDLFLGIVFVSERRGQETLYMALHPKSNLYYKGEFKRNQVFSFDHIFPQTFNGVRMDDGGCFSGGDFLFYVTTKDPAPERRQPWTAVYCVNLKTGESKRLTPSNTADLSPSVSPSGNKIAVASFQGKDGGWNGEIEDLQTNIYVMDVNNPSDRQLVVINGGWPTWGSDDVLFFHRKVYGPGGDADKDVWSVFRVDIRNGPTPDTSTLVTPPGISAMTPAAIDATKVAVATIREKSKLTTSDPVRTVLQYRHIEIFDSSTGSNTKISQNIRPLADHFNPFVIDGGKSIGYHRAKSDLLTEDEDLPKHVEMLASPYPDVALFRVPGVFPTFRKDGATLAYVDNEFRAVWVADTEGSEPRPVYETKAINSVFSPVWGQNPEKDTLYFCKGPSFTAPAEVDIYAIINASTSNPQVVPLIANGSNNAFPSTSPDGTKLVYRSTINGGTENYYKNLYIMEDAQSPGSKITRLTNGPWTDTHCQWSPSGELIVFSSTRDKPDSAPATDNGLDPGYFAVYLVKWNDPSVVVRVVSSANNIPGSPNSFAGHVNHPFFSPDGNSIVVASDLAAVSIEPISLPLFMHSVRPYGDIFTVDIDPDDINKNKDVKDFKRFTHSRYENSTDTWSMFPTQLLNKPWILKLSNISTSSPVCPYINSQGGESWHMTGHLLLPKRDC